MRIPTSQKWFKSCRDQRFSLTSANLITFTSLTSSGNYKDNSRHFDSEAEARGSPKDRQL